MTSQHPAIVSGSTVRGQRYDVLVVGADIKVQYRPVKLGPIIDGLRVVTDGLTVGETIVVSGLQRVRPGSPVTPARSIAAAMATAPSSAAVSEASAPLIFPIGVRAPATM